MEKSDLHLIPMVYNHNVFVYNGIRGTLKTEYVLKIVIVSLI